MSRFQSLLTVCVATSSIMGCADALQLTMTAGKATWDSSVAALSLPSMLQDIEETDELEETVETTDFVGSRVTIAGGSTPLIEGVGLVTGLDGTGGDVPPSSYRRSILDEMRKRNVANPERMLQSPDTAVVIVRSYLPTLAQKDDKLDVEVVFPDGSDSTSLRGGWLLSCDLYEQGYVAGRGRLRDDKAARAEGPILLSPSDDGDLSNAGVVRRGTIPGGGKYIGDNRHLSLNMRSEYRSPRNTKRIADYVGRRFHGFDEYGIRKPLAEAKTDVRIELHVPDVYRDNFPRFLKVIRRVALKESPIETRIRIERLREDLLNEETSEDAAIQLEAIGKDSVVVLREALTADSMLCRFHAATALAYLGDDSGVEVLGNAAAKDRALRVWAFLAMTALDGGQAIPELVTLLDSESVETRYGAIRALTTIDPDHPAIQGREITDQCVLRIVRSTGEPLVHLTKSQKCEITVFGDEQEFHLPMAVRAGRIMVVADASDRTVRLSRFAPGQRDERRTVSPRVADVLEAASELGASYPDLVGLLLEAEEQHNLPGEIAIDALPEGGRLYTGSAFSTVAGPVDGNSEGLDSQDAYEQREDRREGSDFESAEAEPTGAGEFHRESFANELDTDVTFTPSKTSIIQGETLSSNATATDEFASRPRSKTGQKVSQRGLDSQSTVSVGFSPMVTTSGNVTPGTQRTLDAPAKSATSFAGAPPAQGEPGFVR